MRASTTTSRDEDASLRRSLRLVGKLGILLVAFAVPWASARAQSRVAVVPDVPTQVGSSAVGTSSIIVVHTQAGTWGVASDLANVLPPGVGVDALDLVPGGGIVFSTDVPFVSATGLTFDDEDVVLLDHGLLSTVFDGSFVGIRADADVDAVAVVSLSPLDLYFSVDVPVQIGGTVYSDDDILRLQVRTVSLALAGTTLLGAEANRADIDALAIDPENGHFLFSTDVTIAGVGGITRADDEDVLEYTGSGLTLRYDLSTSGLDGARVDVRALALPPSLIVDGFESGAAGAWSFRRP